MPSYDDNPQRVQTRLQRIRATKRGEAVSGNGSDTQVLRKVEQRHVRGTALTISQPRRRDQGSPD